MGNTYEFTAQERTDHGKRFARRMRREQDRLPAVVYGAGKAPKAISLLHKDIFHALQNEAVFSQILNLTVGDGPKEQVVIKDVQRHAFKPKILHIDFLRVKAKEKITMTVPLHFSGEEDAPGVKEEGGQFTKNMMELEIRCLPADLPSHITVDVSKMQIDETLHLSNIELPSGVELVQLELDEAHDHPVISCQVPKVAQADIEAEQQEVELAEEAAVDSAETAASGEEKAEESESKEAEGSEESSEK